MAYIVCLTRAGAIEELKRNYLTMAVLPYRMVVFRRVLLNALILTVIAIATSIGWLFMIEFLYTYPGVGKLPAFAINSPDLPLVRTVVMTTVLVILVANFTAYVLYAVLNPHVDLS